MTSFIGLLIINQIPSVPSWHHHKQLTAKQELWVSLHLEKNGTTEQSFKDLFSNSWLHDPVLPTCPPSNTEPYCTVIGFSWTTAKPFFSGFYCLARNDGKHPESPEWKGVSLHALCEPRARSAASPNHVQRHTPTEGHYSGAVTPLPRGAGDRTTRHTWARKPLTLFAV